MRVYVTGASGFLGKHVVRALEAKGHELIDFMGAECVIHLSARCGGIGRNINEPLEMIADNLESDARAIRWAAQMYREEVKHFIGIGSVCMYPHDAPLPLKEDDIWNGYPEPTNGPYGIAKRVQLELLRAAHAQYGLPYTFLILANLYGPGDHFDREDAHVIPMLVKRGVEAKERGDAFVIWGDGSARRDFLYVEDAADAIVTAVEAGPRNTAINIGTGEEWSIQHVAATIGRYLDVIGYRFDTSKPKGQARRCLDVSRAEDLLNWRRRVPLVPGLERTVQWYLDNRKEPVSV